MDVGYVDYAYLAFKMFGIHVSSLLYLYFAIMFSILLFTINYDNVPLANNLLVLYLVAHYFVITAIMLMVCMIYIIQDQLLC